MSLWGLQNAGLCPEADGPGLRPIPYAKPLYFLRASLDFLFFATNQQPQKSVPLHLLRHRIGEGFAPHSGLTTESNLVKAHPSHPLNSPSRRLAFALFIVPARKRTVGSVFAGLLPIQRKSRHSIQAQRRSHERTFANALYASG